MELQFLLKTAFREVLYDDCVKVKHLYLIKGLAISVDSCAGGGNLRTNTWNANKICRLVQNYDYIYDSHLFFRNNNKLMSCFRSRIAGSSYL